MTLDELQLEAEKDLKMDDLKLADESLKSASLHQKYLNIYNNFRQLKLMNEGTYNVLKRKKWEYYSGKSEVPFELKVLKQDIPMYLEGDEDLIKAKHKVDYHNAMCDFAENVMKTLNNRGFQIKNAIDWKRFLEGSI